MKKLLYTFLLLLIFIKIDAQNVEFSYYANVGNVSQAGDIIDYTFQILPYDDGTFENITFDGFILIYQSGDINSNNIVDSDESWVYTSQYTVTQDDLNNNGYPTHNSGEIVNSFTINFSQVDGDDYSIDIISNTVNIVFGTSLSDIVVCADVEDTTMDIANFDLTIVNSEILNGDNSNDYTISYHLSYVDAINSLGSLASPYTTISDPQTFFARKEKNTDGAFEIFTFRLYVNSYVFANDATMLGCDNGDATATFDLSTARLDIVTNITDGASYHLTLLDAQNGVNAIAPVYSYTTTATTLYVRVVHTGTACVNTTKVLTLTVETCDNTDTDGDGVIDTQETSDGTDSEDPCDFILANQTVTTSIEWNNGDCDGDGFSNAGEVGNGTDPLVSNSVDTDGDGVIDTQETSDGTDSEDPCDFILANQTVTTSTEWDNGDCDSDGISNADEVEEGTNPLISECLTAMASVTVNNIQPNSVILFFEAHDYVSVWELLFEGVATEEASHVELENLTANTTYTFQIRSKCGDDFGEWSYGTFLTAILPAIDVPYNVAQVPYQLYLQDLVETVNPDDSYTEAIDLGFDFNYFGYKYNQVAIGTNSIISFDPSDVGGYCLFAIDSANLLPNADITDNAILGAYQDFNNFYGGTQGFGIIGTAPFRKFVVFFDEVALYGCETINSSNQILLYETYNFIDVQVKDRNVCSSWNNGNAIIGIQSIGGTYAYFPDDRNTGDWEAHNEGHRFKPTYDIPVFQYIICDVDNDEIEVFDLNVVIANFNTGSGDTINVFENEEDAQNFTNALPLSYTNTSNAQTIYIRIDDNSTGAVSIDPILLATIDCNADYDLDTIPTTDEDRNGNGNYGDDDTDGDQIPDFIDEDDDGDFILTNVEAVVITRDNSDTATFLDSDGDQIPNYLDDDDDGDGVLTINEDFDGDGNPANDDRNDDGIPDYLQGSMAALEVNDTNLNNFSIYPNPATDVISIEFNDLQDNLQVKIYSVQGQEVYSNKDITKMVNINIANLSSGVYFINVSNTTQTKIRKFVKK